MSPVNRYQSASGEASIAGPGPAISMLSPLSTEEAHLLAGPLSP